MSNSNMPLNSVVVYEPRLELNRERIFVITKGGTQVTYMGYPSNNWSTNQFSFTTNPPASSNVLDRQVVIEVPFSISFAANAANQQPGANILQPGRDALRCCPLSSITQSLVANFNSFPVNIDLNQVVPALSRYNLSLADKNGLMSTMASCVDNCQSYAQVDGFNNNPLGDYEFAANMAELPRGAYPLTIVNAAAVAGNTATVSGVLRETLILPPFLWQGPQAPGITNLTSLTFQWIFSSNLARLWSHSNITDVGGQSIIGNVAVSFTGAPTLYVGWIQPRLTQPIAPKLTYPYARVSRISQTMGIAPLAPLATGTATSPVLEIDSVPSKIYVYVRQSEALTNANSISQMVGTDSFLRIDKFVFNWGVNTNLFAGASMKNIYDISISNGYNRTWTEFNGISQRMSGTAATSFLGLEGPVVCLVPGKDFGLPDDVAESVNGRWQYQFNLTVQNVHPTASLTPEYVIITVVDGTMCISQGSNIVQSAPVTRSDVMNAHVAENISYNQLQTVYGGNFFNKFTGFASDVNRFLKKYKPISTIAKQIPNAYGQTIGRVADAVGYGLYSGPQSAYAPQGEYEGHGVMAAGAYGGRKMSKSELKKRLNI